MLNTENVSFGTDAQNVSGVLSTMFSFWSWSSKSCISNCSATIFLVKGKLSRFAWVTRLPDTKNGVITNNEMSPSILSKNLSLNSSQVITKKSTNKFNFSLPWWCCWWCLAVPWHCLYSQGLVTKCGEMVHSIRNVTYEQLLLILKCRDCLRLFNNGLPFPLQAQIKKVCQECHYTQLIMIFKEFKKLLGF